jgi:CRP-like cAMP-binding protein
MSWDGRVHVFGNVVPLDELPRKDIDALRAARKEVSFKKGDVLMRQDEPGRAAYLITSGSVAVKRGRKHLADVGPGNLVGEMALLVDEPRNATVTANDDVRAYEISRAAFARVLDKSPAIWWLAAGVLARRLREENLLV